MPETLPGRRARLTQRVRPAIPWLPLVGLIPSFLLASWSLTQPWAKGRAFLVWGISRSPGATLLVIVTLLAMVGSSVAVATRGRRHGPAALLHLFTGVVMVAVALAAFRMIEGTEVKLLGVVPLATIGAGRGLKAFLLASLLVLLLGVIEAIVAFRRREPPVAG
ncbi:MAG: hypothetical protein IT349_05050 [Candidatus Eisenbacteria bacterium]|nr:hypothetical protein [Candidatus Eisenbacteria bacterium]MCC7141451.1 hypothetical protein [Candidatus Eisenbacteria bacterium]